MPRPSLERQITAIRATLRRLDGELRGLVPAIAKATKAAASAKSNGADPARRKIRLSPERRRAERVNDFETLTMAN
jgi:hypothetical protein